MQNTLRRTIAFLTRTLLVVVVVFLTLFLFERHSDRYMPILQSRGQGAGLRHLKRMLQGHYSLPANEIGKNHELIHDAFQPVVENANKGTVVILCDSQPCALGTAITPDRVITKASELSGRIVCRVSGSKKIKANIVAQDKQCDLALLELPGANLMPVTFAQSSSPLIGSWVATASGRSEDPVAVGIVSARQRVVQRDDALLGIIIDEAPEGPQVMRVLEGSAAERIGLKVNDIVIELANQPISLRQQLIRRIQEYRPGEIVELRVVRDGETLRLSAPLGRIDDVLAAEQGFDGHLGGPLSIRRSDFPEIIQHDCIVPAQQCGGPLVDLNGQAVGINIARAGRVSTYALPAELIQRKIAELRWASPTFANSR